MISGTRQVSNLIIGDKEFFMYLEGKKIHEEVKRMAGEISRDLAGMDVEFVVVLKGAFIFASDLLRLITLPMQVSFIRASSYAGMKSTGKVSVSVEPEDVPAHRAVVIVEDIVDSGLTLQTLLEVAKEWKAEQVKIATLLFKPDAYRLEAKPDYTGFHIPSRFVVGYGLDYMGLGRNLPDLYMHAG